MSDVEGIARAIARIDQRIDKLDDRMDRLDDDVRHNGVQFEKMQSDLTAVLEGLADIKQSVAKIPDMEEGVSEQMYDLRAVKAAIKATNQQMADYANRISSLEQRTA